MSSTSLLRGQAGDTGGVEVRAKVRMEGGGQG